MYETTPQMTPLVRPLHIEILNEHSKTKLQISKLKSLMVGLYWGSVGRVSAKKKKKREKKKKRKKRQKGKKSSVHVVTTSFAAEVVIPLQTSQSQLKKHTSK